jgi:outer membrane immunogenic protein
MQARIVFAAAAIAASAGSALAADLPSMKAPLLPPPPPAFSWAGAYAGINIGAVIGNGEFASVVPMTGGGFSGGVGLGYNWQFSPNWVFGVEADAAYRGPVNPGWNQLGWAASSDIGYIGTFRARLGYALDHLLIYATGGLAYGNVIAPRNYGGVMLPGVVGIREGGNDTVLPGWTVGAGAEYALTSNWSVKAEYLYTQLQNSNPQYWVITWPTTIPVSTSTSEHIVRLGVNYRFNWAAPAAILAKY